MLSYLHGFHAGNAADVHKHATYVALLGRLAEKNKPFAVLDCYAGRAVYDLTSTEARKTDEAAGGIRRLARNQDPALAPYLNLVREANPDLPWTVYPGSPELAWRSLRLGDELIVNEMHPREADALRHWARKSSAIHVHKRDAIEALSALLPPRIRRGIVLIDPPYEVKTEYNDIANALPAALKRWPEGIFMVWYPILSEGLHAHLKTALTSLSEHSHLVSEITFAKAPHGRGMLGSGLAIINPPWRFERTLGEIESAVARAIGGVTPSA